LSFNTNFYEICPGHVITPAIKNALKTI